jgi:general secretion pathway protein K
MKGLPHRSQHGAALLLAMLVVTLVASLNAAAYWTQWRSWQVEWAEQQQSQSAWLLTGALDWARLILREDARASTVDHLAEPWAVPLQEARLSTFLAARQDRSVDSALDAVLSGEVTDLQGRINLRNLLPDGGKGEISAAHWLRCQKLFDAVGVAPAEQERLFSSLAALLVRSNTEKADPNPPLMPERFDQLGWLGLSSRSLQALAPHATWLPERSTLNINTASDLALYASVPGLDRNQARKIVQQRSRQHFKSLNEVRDTVPSLAGQWSEVHHGTSSRFFLVRGRLTLDGLTTQETSLLVRHGQQVSTVWRQRGGTTRPEFVPPGPAA